MRAIFLMGDRDAGDDARDAHSSEVRIFDCEQERYVRGSLLTKIDCLRARIISGGIRVER